MHLVMFSVYTYMYNRITYLLVAEIAKTKQKQVRIPMVHDQLESNYSLHFHIVYKTFLACTLCKLLA